MDIYEDVKVGACNNVLLCDPELLERKVRIESTGYFHSASRVICFSCYLIQWGSH